VLALSAAFLAAPAIASDVETGTVLAMLARPLRRADLVIGRWLGLAIMVAGYAALSGLLAITVVGLVSGHVPPEPGIAVGFLALQSLAVLTLALTLGTRLPSIAAGAITVVLFGLGWFAGVLGNIAIAFDAGPLAGGTDLVRVLLPTDGLWRGVIFGLEPPAVLLMAAGRNMQAMQANPFFASTPPPLAFDAWSVAWIAGVLLAGIALFRRREL
jgi:ABC-type transport system involved in multi-copper enzyme maturation permease subunit